jgi:hypothetical protein
LGSKREHMDKYFGNRCKVSSRKRNSRITAEAV